MNDRPGRGHDIWMPARMGVLACLVVFVGVISETGPNSGQAETSTTQFEQWNRIWVGMSSLVATRSCVARRLPHPISGAGLRASSRSFGC